MLAEKPRSSLERRVPQSEPQPWHEPLQFSQQRGKMPAHDVSARGQPQVMHDLAMHGRSKLGQPAEERRDELVDLASGGRKAEGLSLEKPGANRVLELRHLQADRWLLDPVRDQL